MGGEAIFRPGKIHFNFRFLGDLGVRTGRVSTARGGTAPNRNRKRADRRRRFPLFGNWSKRLKSIGSEDLESQIRAVTTSAFRGPLTSCGH